MLAIKLKRIGKKHQPAYRIIVGEKRSKVGGRYVEDLGFWNPSSNQVNIKGDRAKYWIEKGAQPTDTVHNLLVKVQAIKGHKIPVHKVVEKTDAQRHPEAAAEGPQSSSEETVPETPAAEAAPVEKAVEETPAETAPAETTTAEAPTEATEENQ